MKYLVLLLLFLSQAHASDVETKWKLMVAAQRNVILGNAYRSQNAVARTKGLKVILVKNLRFAIPKGMDAAATKYSQVLLSCGISELESIVAYGIGRLNLRGQTLVSSEIEDNLRGFRQDRKARGDRWYMERLRMSVGWASEKVAWLTIESGYGSI